MQELLSLPGAQAGVWAAGGLETGNEVPATGRKPFVYALCTTQSFWLGGLAISWGVNTAMLAQDAPPLQPASQNVSTQPLPDKGAEAYFPPPESAGGWRVLTNAEDIRLLAGMDPEKLAALKEWLLQSDDRNFAAVVIRRGYIVLEVERGNSAKTDSRRVASVSKAVCATVLAIASEQSQHGLTPRKMKFDDPAFDFIPWAQPLSDPRKAQITVKQLLNHTSGICPEATGAPNDGCLGIHPGPYRRRADGQARVRPGHRLRLFDTRAGACGAGL